MRKGEMMTPDMESKQEPQKTGYLSEKDLLLLQQLKILEWYENKIKKNMEFNTPDITQNIENSIVTDKWILTQGVVLYDWQKECIDKWFEKKRGTIKVVTGAGKTILALAIIERLQREIQNELYVVIVVPTIVLMNQWYEEILQKSNLNESIIGRLGGGFKDDFSKDNIRILITVLASAYKELPKIVDKSGISDKLLFIADECHRLGAKEMSEIFQTKRAYNLGLSATPEREVSYEKDDDEIDNDDNPKVEISYEFSQLGKELGDIIYELTLADALSMGIIPQFTINHYGLPLNTNERNKYDSLSKEIQKLKDELSHQVKMGDDIYKIARIKGKKMLDLTDPWQRLQYKLTQRKFLLYQIEARKLAVLRLIEKEIQSNSNARIIIFHEKIDEVMNLFIYLKDNGYPVVAEHSQLPNTIREQGLELFRKGIAKIIVSAKALIEGFNVPEIDVGIIAASSSSVRQRIQSLGRVLRKHRTSTGEEKTSCIHVLYASNTVDDLIYAKESWDEITGIEQNKYYLWDIENDPIPQDGPPRRPPKKENEINIGSLKIGEAYEGAYDGEEYSCDSNGNIVDVKGRYVKNPQDIPKLLKEIKGTYGRFKVTPINKYVLIRVPSEDEDWKTIYITKLNEPFILQNKTTTLHDEEVINKWVENAELGDVYPFEYGKKDLQELRIKHSANGLKIAKKVPRGEIYARDKEKSQNKIKGENLEILVHKINELSKKGEQIKTIQVNALNHFLFRKEGKLFFICVLKEGLEFPD